jgi:ribosome biogenesis protein Tsr3
MARKIKLYVKFGEPYSPNAFKKCTAALCVKHGLMKIVDEIPSPSLLLSPIAEQPLTKEDKDFVEKNGISLIDAPWESLPGLSSKLGMRIRQRRVEGAIEVVGAYKESEWRISTAGAAAYALYSLGYKNQALEILDPFPWKHEFIKANFEK